MRDAEDEREVCRRYALALAFVPDANAAGDLFMAARDEADLRRRAAAWRRRQGLSPLDSAPPLPALDPEQVELALHLHRRQRRQRRRRPLLAGAAALLLAAALFAAGRSLAPGQAPTLAGDPAFATPAADQATSGNLTLALHRAESTPAGITVWWSLSGPGAGSAAASLRPELFDLATGQWAGAANTQLLPQRSAEGEVVRGRSLYRVRQITWRTAMLHASGGFGDLRAPIQRGPDPTAPSLKLHETASSGPVSITLTGITLGADYTALRYEARLPSPELRFGARAVIDTGDGVLEPVDGDVTFADNLVRVQAIYPPLPPGTQRVTIRFSLFAALGHTTAFTMNLLTQVQRIDTTVKGVVDLSGLGGERPADAVYVDEHGAEWRVDTFEPADDNPAHVRAVANGVPPEPRLVKLVIYSMEHLPQASVSIDLKQA